MADNKLQVIVTDEALLKEVTFNYDQLKASLSRKLKKYKDIVVSEESIKDAKEDRAELNSIEKVLATKSSEIQKKILNGFEVKMKELRTMIKDVSGQIDIQVKALEQKTKDKKRADIELIYSENIGDLKDLLPLNSFFNDSWLNATVTPVKTDGTFNYKKVEAEIVAFISKVRQDLAVINTLNSEFELQIKDHYLRFFDLSGALAEKARLEAAKVKIAAVSQAANAVPQPAIAPANDTMANVDWANTSIKPQIVLYKITGTVETFNFIDKFLQTNKIKYLR